jgi:hypothetical protein
MREVPESAEHHRAVFATFQEQAAQVELRAPGARAILSLAAFYAPDNIPEELFTQTAGHYPAALAPVANPVKLEQAIGALNRFSLVDFVADTRTFAVHRLVQAARIGDVLRAQGNLPAARDRYETSVAIFDRLAKADPGSADWQHDLAVSHERMRRPTGLGQPAGRARPL